MLKMKLPMRTAEEGGDDTAEDDLLEQTDIHNIPRSSTPLSASDRLEGSPRHHHGCPSQLDKETVFEWFGLHLNPSKRIEFMCGLLHMCQPLELRFLGSCLEDLARKDYHVLRDFEIRANSPSDMGILSDVIDPVVRSKLLVCLSLLGSDSRECAGILFRILSHVDPALFYKNYGYSVSSFRDPPHPFHSCAEGNVYGRSEQICGLSNEAATGPLEQLALLFMMTSLHPAFPFHQRETVRGQLDKIELAIEEERQLRINAQITQQKIQQQQQQGPDAYLSSGQREGGLEERTVGRTGSVDQGQAATRCSSQTPPSRRTQREAVHIEKIVLRGISRSRMDREYTFEVMWSDSSLRNVTKTHLELENFLLKLPKEQCIESFEKGLLKLLNQGDKYESREVERSLSEKFLSAPSAFRQTRKVCSFFRCDSSYSFNPICSRCNSVQLGKTYQEDCSDASSQEEDIEPYVQGLRKKHGSKSPSLSAKGSKGESRKGTYSSEGKGKADWRNYSSSLENRQEPGTEQHQQDCEKRSSRTKARVLGSDREKARKGGAVFMTNGSVVPPRMPLGGRQPQGKDVGSSQDTYGDTSSECSSSSPQHRGDHESLDSEDDNHKDTDSHSDDPWKGPLSDAFFSHQGEPVMGDLPVIHPLTTANPQPDPLYPATSPEFPPLSFMHPLSYVLPNGATETPIQSVFPEMKPSSSALVMQIPPVPLAAPTPRDPEKKDVTPAVLPAFGAPSMGLQAPGSPALQPLVQRFKTSPAQTQTSSDLVAGGGCGGGPTPVALSHSAPVGAISVIAPGPTPYASPLQPGYTSPEQGPGPPASLPLVEPSPLAKHPVLALPSALPQVPYAMPTVPGAVMSPLGVAAAGLGPGGVGPSTGQVQSGAPLAVPTHTPGPAPSPSPALTHSTAQSECTSYINSSTSSGTTPLGPGNTVAHQQLQQQQQPATPQQQQQQPSMGCGTCGCLALGNCVRGVNSNAGVNAGVTPAASHAPFFFPAHQMAAVRQMFGVPPALFHLNSLCSSSYLPQPAHQTNGATASLSPYYAPAPPPAPQPPYAPGTTLLHPPAHSHSAHSHSDVQSHLLNAAAAAAGYGLQQMAPAGAFGQRFYAHVYPSTLGLVGAAGVNKKNGNVSCYNCGVNGHYAQDCNQPSIESAQQGGFRLKFAPHSSDALDNAD